MLALGANQAGGERFTGLVSEYRLYNVALDASEAKALYDLGRTPPPPAPAVPRPGNLVVDFDTTVNTIPTDISGSGNHGTLQNGASYSTVEKAFDLTVGYVSGTHGLVGSTPAHSHSVWFKRTASSNNWEYVCVAGTLAVGQQSGILIAGSPYVNRIIFNFYGGELLSTVTAELNVWYHVVATYSGASSAIDLTTCKIYIDGEDRTEAVWRNVAFSRTLRII